jgi:hypothetical protein
MPLAKKCNANPKVELNGTAGPVKAFILTYDTRI